MEGLKLDYSFFPDLRDQLTILHFYFPEIEATNFENIPLYFPGFAFVNWKSIAKDYPTAVKKILSRISKDFEVNLLIDIEKIKREENFEVKEKVFWGNVKFFRNYSAKEVKEEVKKIKGFGLGIFEILCLISILANFKKLPVIIAFVCIGDYHQKNDLIYHPCIHIVENRICIYWRFERIIEMECLIPIFI